jgi:hypothetical protein
MLVSLRPEHFAGLPPASAHCRTFLQLNAFTDKQRCLQHSHIEI